MVDETVINFLAKLQVSAEGSRIFALLSHESAVSAQVIARKTGIPKTNVYRRVEELKSAGLVLEQIEENRRTYRAASSDQLSLVVMKKELEAAELRQELPKVSALLQQDAANADPETKVLFYKGRDGIRQMIWNVLRAKTEVVGFTYRDISPFVGKRFHDHWRETFMARGLRGRDIYSDGYIASKFDPNAKRYGTAGWQEWEGKYCPPGKLNINYQMDVYNDIVGIYNWAGEDVFGIELYNAKVAAAQRQIFELLWLNSSSLTLKQQKSVFEALNNNK